MKSNQKKSTSTNSQRNRAVDAHADHANELNQQIHSILRIRRPDFVFRREFGHTVTRSKLANFENLNWLNDENVDFYFKMVCWSASDCLVLPCAFYLLLTWEAQQLQGRPTVFHQASQFTIAVDLFAFRLVFIPIIENQHWTLAVVNNQDHTIDYYDSLGGCNFPVQVQMFIGQELRRHNRDEIWCLRIVTDHPRQYNGSDCGPFICQYGKHLAFRLEMLFNQVNSYLIKLVIFYQ